MPSKAVTKAAVGAWQYDVRDCDTEDLRSIYAVLWRARVELFCLVFPVNPSDAVNSRQTPVARHIPNLITSYPPDFPTALL